MDIQKLEKALKEAINNQNKITIYCGNKDFELSQNDKIEVNNGLLFLIKSGGIKIIPPDKIDFIEIKKKTKGMPPIVGAEE